MNAIIVSDLHIGSRYFLCRDFERLLVNISNGHELILNGDIIDDPREKLEPAHQRILDLIRGLSCTNTVVWIRGNHEDGHTQNGFGNVRFRTHHSIGDKLLVTHGHYFDKIMPRSRLFIGAFNLMHQLRLRCGAKPVHVAEYAKKWRSLYKVLTRNVMTNAVKCALKNGYGAVTCGHTHYPEDAVINGVRYINTGSWTEHPALYLHVTGHSMTLKRMDDPPQA